MANVFINPFTDFGFKHLFGTEPNKELLRHFLNELLYQEQGKIIDIQYLNNENLGNTLPDRKAIFDLYCTNERGEKFIVELQKTKQKFFKDRSIYYATFPIREQAQKGDAWDFELTHIYTIAILDFVFDDDKQNNQYRYDVKLTELHTGEVFYDKLTFVYLSMPKFKKTLSELNNNFEKWLYAFKHLSEFDSVPNELTESIFLQFFERAKIANFSPDEYKSYENSLKYYRDLKNSLDTAREEGIALGIIETAKNLKSLGVEIKTIQQATGLSDDDIKKL
ncbi:Rpn family recombination-promoting nuclease/putative transposase [Moraxella oblonga]|uniref:Rpn family recombination-promoting nuclease/putative transposase n=1 Tax=Moraxella oblonga TaxID=200413 RepID=UPI00082FF6CE|nr:Rpn family recombination-promoting nuclease/putative transposase [Moraxella oblonga]